MSVTSQHKITVYAELASLLAMQSKTSLLPAGGRIRVNHPLTGSQVSHQRGRGLNFEELRHYQVGDDIRQLDWKVTHRTGKPHVRVYSEEKEQDVILLVDQRISMFFGSAAKMKSVIAAELAALLAWQAIGRGDRVGMMIVQDEGCIDIRPQRSRDHVVHLLDQLVKANHALRAGISGRETQFNASLRKLVNLARHGKHLWIISDFHGSDAKSLQMLGELARHNTLSVAAVYDQLETRLPDGGLLSLTDGDRHVDINTGDRDLRARFQAQVASRWEQLEALFRKHRVAVVPVQTQQALETQLKQSVVGD